MLVSCAWLEELCPTGAPPRTVADLLTARGLTVDAVSTSDGDTVLDVDVPANRPDCQGHLGFARELSAATGVPVRPPQGPAATAGALPFPVRVEAPELCPLYTARLVRGVRVGPSPAWAVRRLEACGLRSINTVVDASNLVLLGLGQPVHTFDAALLRGPAVVVRRARAGERLVTLDGVDRGLRAGMLVIADADRPVALAGIVGGMESAISDATRDVLVEVAAFEPGSIRATARALALLTDASQRFERGVDAAAIGSAQAMTISLLVQMAGGQPVPGEAVVGGAPGPAPRRTLRLSRLRALLGYDPGASAARDALARLGLRPEVREGDVVEVEIPSWRADLGREVDLIEEVARHLGYDRIPSRLPVVAARASSAAASGAQEAAERVRERLAHLGFHETLTYAMVSDDEDRWFSGQAPPAALRLTNPLSESLATLRRSLGPGLLRAADLNLRRGVRDVRLFEIGRAFDAPPEDGRPVERLRAGLAWSGASRPRHWTSGADRTPEVDLAAVAGVVESLLRAAHVEVGPREEASRPGLDPRQTVTWGTAAWAGRLAPDLLARLDLPAPVYLAEIDLQALGEMSRPRPAYRAVPRVPAVARDLAVVLPPSTRYAAVASILQEVPAPAPATLEVVDRYEGAPLAPGEVSLTVRVILQPLDRTLTEGEVEHYRAALVDALGRAGVGLRG